METIPSFLDTAIFFALSVAIGMLATYISQGFTKYEERILGYVALLAALPLHTVLPLSCSALRRKSLRQGLASLATILLCLGAVFMMGVGKLSRGNDRWGLICFGYNIRFRSGRTIATNIIVVLATFWSVLGPGILPIGLRLRRMITVTPRPSSMTTSERGMGYSSSQQSGPSFKHWGYDQSTRLGKITVWVTATSTLASTFFAGGCLIHDRQLMKALAGKSYNESDMSYGQYLAALIWLPVVVEYLYHIKCK